MNRYWLPMCVLCLVALLATNAVALEIEVAPKTLVLSSPGGNVTVHTDVPFVLAETVSLSVDGVAVDVRTYSDLCGNLVAQCGKEVVKEVIGDSDVQRITLTLTVDDESDSKEIRVKK